LDGGEVAGGTGLPAAGEATFAGEAEVVGDHARHGGRDRRVVRLLLRRIEGRQQRAEAATVEREGGQGGGVEQAELVEGGLGLGHGAGVPERARAAARRPMRAAG
jgi:hypothetical protein